MSQCTCYQAWHGVTPPPPCPVHSHYVPACQGHCHCHCHCQPRYVQPYWQTTTTPWITVSSNTVSNGTFTSNGTTATFNFSSGDQGPDEEPPAASTAPVS